MVGVATAALACSAIAAVVAAPSVSPRVAGHLDSATYHPSPYESAMLLLGADDSALDVGGAAHALHAARDDTRAWAPLLSLVCNGHTAGVLPSSFPTCEALLTEAATITAPPAELDLLLARNAEEQAARVKEGEAEEATRLLSDALARLRRVATTVHEHKAATQKSRGDEQMQDWVKLYDDGEMAQRAGEAAEVAASEAALRSGADGLVSATERAAHAFFLGSQYEFGRKGKTFDLARAEALYSEAAALGSVDATYGLGRLAEGRGAFVEAVTHFHDAAAREHAGALGKLGQLTLRGAGRVTKDEEEGIRLLHRAASAGDAQAALHIGLRSFLGSNSNWTEALRWFRVAAPLDGAEARLSPLRRKWHITAGYYAGVIASRGGDGGGVRDAVRYFRRVAEYGATHHMDSALAWAQQGGTRRGAALLAYELKASMGYTLGMTNAAYLYGQKVCPAAGGASTGTVAAAAAARRACQWKAHDWWESAAVQGRLDAILRVGDWHFYGGAGPNVAPVTTPNKTRAAAFYARIIAEPQRNRFTSHALFNSALMEADGSGGTGGEANWTRVRELFDAAVEADPVLQRSALGAALRVALALCATAPVACRTGVVGAGAAIAAVGGFWHDWFGGGSGNGSSEMEDVRESEPRSELRL